LFVCFGRPRSPWVLSHVSSSQPMSPHVSPRALGRSCCLSIISTMTRLRLLLSRVSVGRFAPLVLSRVVPCRPLLSHVVSCRPLSARVSMTVASRSLRASPSGAIGRPRSPCESAHVSPCQPSGRPMSAHVSPRVSPCQPSGQPPGQPMSPHVSPMSVHVGPRVAPCCLSIISTMSRCCPESASVASRPSGCLMLSLAAPCCLMLSHVVPCRPLPPLVVSCCPELA
jgi:hypothetical protein